MEGRTGMRDERGGISHLSPSVILVVVNEELAGISASTEGKHRPRTGEGEFSEG